MRSLLSFLNIANFLVAFGVNAVVLYFSLVAYRRTKMLAFACLIGSCALAILQTVAAHTLGMFLSILEHSNFEMFQVCYRTVEIVRIVLGAAGTVMLVRYLLTGVQKAAHDT
jgi:hypothetical protein